MIRKLIPNYEFIESIDDKFIDDFVNVPDGIPDLLMNILEMKDSNIGLKRMFVFQKHPEYESKDQDERIIASNMMKDNKIEEAQEYRVKNALDFLNKYPRFKNIVSAESL